MHSQTQLQTKNLANKTTRCMKIGLLFLAITLFFTLTEPMIAFADIESSVNNAGKSIFTTIKNISGMVGAAIIAAGWLGNMLPIVEISQKAKMWIIRAGVGIVGISFTMQLVEWFQKMN
ncbi:hypothetical protein IGI96_002899 [Enterococcus sp. DIV0421]|uniref:hypothetical protein n=1 Tax=Enterococcus sp. DIV0421 TaxID=2774688 RepID=UPI003F22311B